MKKIILLILLIFLFPASAFGATYDKGTLDRDIKMIIKKTGERFDKFDGKVVVYNNTLTLPQGNTLCVMNTEGKILKRITINENYQLIATSGSNALLICQGDYTVLKCYSGIYIDIETEMGNIDSMGIYDDGTFIVCNHHAGYVYNADVSRTGKKENIISTEVTDVYSTKGRSSVKKKYTLTTSGGKKLYESNNVICDIGCGLYSFSIAKSVEDGLTIYKYGVLDSNGNVIINPEYDEVGHAVNNIVTLRKDGYFYVFDNKGDLKKKVKNDLMDYFCKDRSKPEFAAYHILDMSGSNVVAYEHKGDMVIEFFPDQKFIIKRLFSETIAGEPYWGTIPLENGEFIAYDDNDSKTCILNADGSLKVKTKYDYLVSLDNEIFYGYINYKGVSDRVNTVDIINNKGEILAEGVQLNTIQLKPIIVNMEKRTIHAVKGGNPIEVKY